MELALSSCLHLSLFFSILVFLKLRSLKLDHSSIRENPVSAHPLQCPQYLACTQMGFLIYRENIPPYFSNIPESWPGYNFMCSLSSFTQH